MRRLVRVRARNAYCRAVMYSLPIVVSRWGPASTAGKAVVRLAMPCFGHSLKDKEAANRMIARLIHAERMMNDLRSSLPIPPAPPVEEGRG